MGQLRLATIRHNDIKEAAVKLLDEVDGFKEPFERLTDVVNRIYEDLNGDTVNVTVTDVLTCLIEETMIAAADDSGILLYLLHDGQTNELGMEGLMVTSAKLLALHEKGEVMQYSMELVELVEERMAQKEKKAKAQKFLLPMNKEVNDGE